MIVFSRRRNGNPAPERNYDVSITYSKNSERYNDRLRIVVSEKAHKDIFDNAAGMVYGYDPQYPNFLILLPDNEYGYRFIYSDHERHKGVRYFIPPIVKELEDPFRFCGKYWVEHTPDGKYLCINSDHKIS